MTAYLWGHVDPLAVNAFLLASIVAFFAYVCIHLVDREVRIYRKAKQPPPEREPYDKEALDRLWWAIMLAGDHPFEEEK